jgi:hypothetical protein
MITVQKLFTKTELRTASRSSRITLPLCKDCQFLKNGNCSKFTYKNLVNGDETSVPAIDARSKYDMCGTGGSHFQPAKLKVELTTDDM